MLDTKVLGEQLGLDVIEIATRHNSMKETLSERLYEVLSEPQNILKLEVDKGLLIEGALAEFRETFTQALEDIFQECKLH